MAARANETPLTRHTHYEIIDLMRGDLFELLDLLTTHFFDHPESHAANNVEIRALPTG